MTLWLAMAESPLSILMVMESVFPSPGGGGAESQVRTLGLELVKRGHLAHLVVPMVSAGPTVEHEHLDGMAVTRIPYPKVPLLGAAWMLWCLAWLLIKRRHDYQVIHAHIAGNMAAVCAVVGKLLGKPVLVKLTGMTEMKGGILDPHPRATVRLRRGWLRMGSAYQATSLHIANQLVQAGFERQKVLTLPNGVDTSRFREPVAVDDLQEAFCSGKSLVGIYVGRLEQEKGLDLLLAAWAAQFAGRQDTALLLVGSGSLEHALHALGQQLGIADQVKFLGPRADVERCLALANVGLLASEFEGLSNSLLEYMAAGLPVVGSRVSGTEDWVVNGQTGWIFTPGDEAGLRSALAEMAQAGVQELLRLGNIARERIDHQASVEVVVRSLCDLYARLRQGHG
ncbi:MAG: glycosyltransferase family 4 protein [Rubrivivax sp.]